MLEIIIYMSSKIANFPGKNKEMRTAGVSLLHLNLLKSYLQIGKVIALVPMHYDMTCFKIKLYPLC